MLFILLGNTMGCILAAVMAYYSLNESVQENLTAILDVRSTASWVALLLTSMGTGMIMTLAVYGARKKHFLPLLFGVPVFILCGLPHCIADAFYYALALLCGDFEWLLLVSWVWAIVGNYIGCNIPRWFMREQFEF